MTKRDTYESYFKNLEKELKNIVIATSEKDKGGEKWTIIRDNVIGEDADKDWYSFIKITHTILIGKENGENNKKQLSHFISEASKKYKYINQLEIDQNDKDLEEYKELMNDVHKFITNEHHSLILAMLIKDAKMSEINKVLRYLLNIAIKKFYFKNESPSTITIPLNNILEKYKDKRKMDIEKIIKELENISKSIDNEELKNSINQRRIKSNAASKKAKFILKELFNTACLKNESKIRDDFKDIDLEHILPQGLCKKETPDSQWIKDFSKEGKEFYAFKIGNLTLLEAEINRPLGNKDFCIKRVKYRDSAIKENRMIAHVRQWTKCEIDCRSQILSIRIIEYLDSLLDDSE